MIACCCFGTPASSFGQAPEAPRVERSIVLEQFERVDDSVGPGSESHGWHVRSRQLDGGTAIVRTDDLEPPPLADNDRYLSVRFRAPVPAGFRIDAREAVRIPGYLRRLEVWVQGQGQGDEFYADLIDADGRHHRLFAATLSFAGWRRLEIVPPPEFARRSSDGRVGVFFRGFSIRPRQSGGDSYAIRLGLDQVTAIVRDYDRRPASPPWEI